MTPYSYHRLQSDSRVTLWGENLPLRQMSHSYYTFLCDLRSPVTLPSTLNRLFTTSVVHPPPSFLPVSIPCISFVVTVYL